MNRELAPLSITALVSGGAIAIASALLIVLPALSPLPPWGALPQEIETAVQIEVFVTTFNLVLLVALTGFYVSLYRDLPNKYTRSLLLLSVALMMYAFTSNPVVHMAFGFEPRPAIGLFGYLSDLFVGVAVLVLLYQSQT